MKTRLSLAKIATILLTTLTIQACGGASSSSEKSSTNAPVQTESAQATEDTRQSEPKVFQQWPEGAPAGLSQAWAKLISGGQYRLATQRDFHFPVGAEKVIQAIKAFPKEPFLRIHWDINGDGDRNDFLAMVVDTTRSDDARFGIVILSKGQKASGIYQAYWVFRDRDFSQTIVTTASSTLFVQTYKSDASITGCVITWDKRYQRFICE